jgi:4-hydroxy-tetrahydrodipicolinate reductase
VGLSLAPAILASEDLTLSGAVSRTYAGRSLRDAFAIDSDVVASSSVINALRSATGVLVDFTAPNVVHANVMAAIERGVNVIIGTSGLTDADYEQIDNRARQCGVGVLAAGNFALTAVLLQRFAAITAKYIPHWEIIDYAHDDKIDAPSGTARELAHRLSTVRAPEIGIPLDQVHGIRESRGATVQQTQIHSVRSPGYVIGVEIVFGLKDERLQIRHDAGNGAAPYVGGVMLGIRSVTTFKGLRRGLDSVMDL